MANEKQRPIKSFFKVHFFIFNSSTSFLTSSEGNRCWSHSITTPFLTLLPWSSQRTPLQASTACAQYNCTFGKHLKRTSWEKTLTETHQTQTIYTGTYEPQTCIPDLREPRKADSSQFCQAKEIFIFLYRHSQQTQSAAIKTKLCKDTLQSLTAQDRKEERKTVLDSFW